MLVEAEEQHPGAGGAPQGVEANPGIPKGYRGQGGARTAAARAEQVSWLPNVPNSCPTAGKASGGGRRDVKSPSPAPPYRCQG